jgi:Holliday junction resolvase RusA-like endonuclease
LGDLDNHLKLVLDAMNDTIYPDDRQVVIICALKIADNVGMSNGSTEVIMQKIRARDIHLALSSMRM